MSATGPTPGRQLVPRPRWAPRSVAAAAFAIVVVLVLAELRQPPRPPAQLLMYVGLAAAWLSCGILLLERRRGNAVGWDLFIVGLLLAAYLTIDALVGLGVAGPGVTWAAFAITLMDGPLFLLVAMLFLLFPDGSLPSPRWRWLVAAGVVLVVPVVAGAAVHPGVLTYYPSIANPMSDPGSPFNVTWEVAYGLQVLVVGGAALSLVVRWRHAGPLVRAQLKWVASAAVLLAIAMVTYGGTAGPGTYSEAGDIAVGIGFGAIPVAITIAILRYHLYEIDRIVSRTVGWAIVTGLLVAVFAVVVVALQAVLEGFTQGETLAVAASTLVALALFQPLRGRVQRAVDRRFNRPRYDAVAATDAFASRLRIVPDVGAVEDELRRSATAVMHPRHAAVWLRGRGDARPAAP